MKQKSEQNRNKIRAAKGEFAIVVSFGGDAWAYLCVNKLFI